MAGQQYMGGMAQGAGTIGSGLNMQISGLSNVLNNQTKMAISNQENSILGGIGAIAAAGLSAYTGGAFKRG